MQKILTIAIDGPSGSGKSSVAKHVAQQLHILHLNTGALYRAIGLYAYRKGYETNRIENIKNDLDKIVVEVQYTQGLQHTYLNGEDVTPLLKSKIADEYSAAVSDLIEVRKKVLAIQQSIGNSMSVVMEGRDICSVVLPNATYKFFVTASVETRTQRRYEEYLALGKNMSYEEVREGIIFRDYKDAHRVHSPLIQKEDAILIESDYETLDETVARVLSYIEKGERR